MTPPTPIIIDTDPGVDDAMAILFALASPELDVLGLTTVFGNHPDVSLLTRNALALLELAGRADIPVAAGAARTLIGSPAGGGASVHGANGLGGVELPKPSVAPLAVHAAAFIAETCQARPGQVTLVALAPLTNLALALHLCPELPQLAPRIVLMGGAATAPGNATATGESNIVGDPEAARMVFNAGWEIVMAGLDVTQLAPVGGDYLDALAGVGNRAGVFIRNSSQHYLSVYLRRGEPGLAMHDVHAIAALTHPGFYKSKRVYIDVETRGELTRGQTVADWRGRAGRPAQTTLLTGVDAPALRAAFRDRIAALP
jgi:inosine-uridine nucleoside N-ribohydrolase